MSSILNATTSSGLQIAPDNSGSLQLQTNNGTTALTIDTSQNVGIGTASPGGRLHLDTTNDTIFRMNTSGTNIGYLEAYTGGATPLFAIYSVPVNGNMTFGTNNTERMRIDSSGNVGIGTSSPVGDVTRYLNIVGSGGAGIFLHDSNQGVTVSDGTTLQAAGVNAYLYNREAGFIAVGTSNTERMRIASNGAVLINETDSTTASPQLQITGSSATYNQFVIKDTSTTYSTSARMIYFLNSSGASAGVISHSAVTTTTYGTSSDERLKNDICIADDTSVIDNIKVHKFEWKQDKSIDVGVFAQEAYNIKPTAVIVGDDELTEDGNLKNAWAVDYSKFVPDLIIHAQQLKKQVQEQQELIKQLQADIAELKTK